MSSIKMMKKQIYYETDPVIDRPTMGSKTLNSELESGANRSKSNDKDLSYTCCRLVKINDRLLYIIGCGELVFLLITLSLTTAHFARFSILTDSMPAILITILVGVSVGLISTVLFFMGIRKRLTYALKIHYIGHAVASCLLFMSFVFVFTSVYGEFDESYFYGERSPPIIVVLGVVWAVASPLSVLAGLTVRRYYKIVQNEKRKLKQSFRNNTTSNGDNSHGIRATVATEQLEEVAAKNQQQSFLNGSATVSPRMANGQQGNGGYEIFVTDEPAPHGSASVVVCDSPPFEKTTTPTASLKGDSAHTESDAEDDRATELYEDICDKADGGVSIAVGDLTYQQMCDLEAAEAQSEKKSDPIQPLQNSG